MFPENTLLIYADDSTLLAEVPKPSERKPAIFSLNCGLAQIGDWCKRWGMLVNDIKTKGDHTRSKKRQNFINILI